MYLELFLLLNLPLVCNISSRSPLSIALPCGVGIPKVSKAVRSFPGSNPNAGRWLIYTVNKQMEIKQNLLITIILCGFIFYGYKKE